MKNWPMAKFKKAEAFKLIILFLFSIYSKLIRSSTCPPPFTIPQISLSFPFHLLSWCLLGSDGVFLRIGIGRSLSFESKSDAPLAFTACLMTDIEHKDEQWTRRARPIGSVRSWCFLVDGSGDQERALSPFPPLILVRNATSRPVSAAHVDTLNHRSIGYIWCWAITFHQNKGGFSFPVV